MQIMDHGTLEEQELLLTQVVVKAKKMGTVSQKHVRMNLTK